MSIEIFSLRLKNLMELEGISKKGLADKAKVQRKSILNWLNGKFYPRYDSLIDLADYFSISTDCLLGLEEECYSEDFEKHPMEEIPRIFLSRLEKLLKEQPMSQYKLAKALEIGHSSISKWRHQGSIPETEFLIKMTEIFGTTVDYLLGRNKV